MGTAMMTIICRILKYCLQGITTTLHDFACLCLLLSDNIVQCWIFNNMYLLPVSRPALIQRTSIIMIIILPSTFILLGKKNLPMFFSPAVQCSQGNVPRSHMNLLRGKRKKKSFFSPIYSFLKDCHLCDKANKKERCPLSLKILVSVPLMSK